MGQHKYQKNIVEILKILDFYFPNPKVPLNYINHYTFLLAVILSAQCTDARVNIVTGQLFPLASTPEDLIFMGREKLIEIIHPCGLYKTKSKNIIETSEILIKKFNSQVPDNFDDLESLPGVGHKTASVLMSHLFHQPAFPVDTHIYRLAKRWGLSSGKNVKEVESDLKKLFHVKLWYKLHLQMISFGREYCKATRHKKEDCPVCSRCEMTFEK